ncbi:hypothetical protein [Streptomyces sp. NPDC050535]|uniref:hypothetical protein n=1 Tax=Streptomyces sp. NPDC050535 TaxID=3365626 RepID=UPI0037A7C646
MAQLSWPSPGYNDRAVNDTEYEAMAGRFSDDGVDGAPTDTAVVSAGTGLTVNVRADAHASVRGHAWTSGPSTVALAVGANSSGSTRVDRVVLRLDRSTWTVRAVVKAGTPGAGAPPLTQQTGDTGVYEVLLAGVTVLNGAAAVSVTRAETYIGARIRPALSSHRNPNPVVGEMCLETDTGRIRAWNGDAWTIVYSNSGTVTLDALVAGWDSVASSVLEVRSGAVHLRLGGFRRVGSTLAADTESRLPVLIPSAYRHPSRDQYALAYVSGVEIARLIIYSAADDRPGQVWITNKPSISNGESVFPASGISWVVD